ncbi:MAG: ORF6N domain-containing protein [Fluviicola sp.]|jgi:hypothetical protein|nr:ORF6N domain-containing protein [Fluviicola sp.]
MKSELRLSLSLKGQKVMLDYDLAEIYEVENKRLKESVKRNIERFPLDYMFVLTKEEFDSLRSQIATLKKGRGAHSKYLPFAFTEQGVAMLSSILNSPKAIETNILIIKSLVYVRSLNISHKDLDVKIKELGFTVIRFSEGKVLQNIGEVYQQIYRVVEVLRGD